MTSENIMKERWDQLGLPPMELAESSENNSRPNSGLHKCLLPSLHKLVIMLLLTTFGVGTYVLLLRLSENYDYTRNTEIIILTGNNEIPNVTVHNMELFLQLKNETADQKILSQPKEKRKKRHISDPVASTEMEDTLDLNDEQLQKARKIILEHDVLCNNDKKQEICKDYVTKLKAIVENKGESKTKQNPSKIKLKGNEHGEHDVDDVKSKLKDVAPTDLTKREILPNSNLDIILDSVPTMHLEPSSGPYARVSHSHSMSPQHLSDTCLLARLLKEKYPHAKGIYDPSPAYLAPHYEHPLLPKSRYNSPDMHASYLQERDIDLQRHKIHPQDVDIFMSLLTSKSEQAAKPRSSNSSREASCPPGMLPCLNGEDCVEEKQWCDGNVDCIDVSDEASCACKSRVDKSRLCDGYFDCPFGEDEMGCYGCSDTMFSCEDLDINSRSTCFTKEQRCNNVVECPNQKDEIECNMLAPSLLKKPLFAISNTEGFLHRNFKGNWFAVCQNPYMWAHDACRRETGLIIRPPFIQIVPIDPMIKIDYLNTGPGGLVQTSATCMNSSAVYVTCPDLLCGTRVQSTSQLLREDAAIENRLFGRNKRFLLKNHPYPLMLHRYDNRLKRDIDETRTEAINYKKFDRSKRDFSDTMRNKRTESRVVGGRPSQPAAWPWMVALYRNGMFHCGGVVITHSWVVSAAHCVHKFWDHYFEVQVGMLRRFSFSPQEQSHKVTHVIVNPHYSQDDMKNDLSLLKVEPAIQFSRWVRPICLPNPDTAGPDWLWGPAPGTICTSVGWGSTTEHGPDPDHMREVEVPIWSNCKHREDRVGNEICAGLVEGGKDSCQGDSGGPLLCRNPLNSQQWYMAGIVSHGDGCARKDEPGVYTRVSLFVKWIKYHISSQTLPKFKPIQECPGFKCKTGISKCLPNKRKCDKIVDCLDGEDETKCQFVRSVTTLPDSIFADPQSSVEETFETKEVQTKSPKDIKSSKDKNQEVTTPAMKSLEDYISTETEKIVTSSDSNHLNSQKSKNFDLQLEESNHAEQLDFKNKTNTPKPNESIDTDNFDVERKNNSIDNLQTKDTTDTKKSELKNESNVSGYLKSKEATDSEYLDFSEEDDPTNNSKFKKSFNADKLHLNYEENISDDLQINESTNTDKPDFKKEKRISDNPQFKDTTKAKNPGFNYKDHPVENLKSKESTKTDKLDFKNKENISGNPKSKDLEQKENSIDVTKTKESTDAKKHDFKHEENVINNPKLTKTTDIKKTNFGNAYATPDIYNDESSENFSMSEETATADPKRAISTELTSPSRGDMEMTSMDISAESLEPGSSVLEQKETTTPSQLNQSESNSDDDNNRTETLFENKIETSTSASTHNNNEGLIEKNASRTLLNRLDKLPYNNLGKKTEETTSLLIKLLPNLNSTETDQQGTETEIINEDNNNTDNNLHQDPPSTEKLPDINHKSGTANQMEEDIVFSDLEPAKVRRRHRNPIEFKCRRIEQTIAFQHRCDRKADCEDGTDELDCTCIDFLQTFDEKFICDGIIDCVDGQDEVDCYSCPEDHSLCKRSRICVPEKHVCDGKAECPQGEDEQDCFALTNGEDVEIDLDGRPTVKLEGYVTKKYFSDWHIVCNYDVQSIEEQEKDATQICRDLGFSTANRYSLKYISFKEDEDAEHSSDNKRNRRDAMKRVPIHFAFRKESEDNSTAQYTIIKDPVIKEECVPNNTKICKSLYVSCEDSLFHSFNVSEKTSLQKTELVSNHAWPWIAKVFVEGDYRCTGVLVKLSWVLVSESCLWDSTLSRHFITVVLGSHRTLVATNGLHEQVYQVDSKKDIYRSKSTLLHLREPARYSNLVKPMVVASSYSIEQKSTCVAIGQDNNNNTISVFLEETSEHCHSSNRCFKRTSREKICPLNVTNHRHWAGIVSCHTEQGWYPAASFVDSRGECGLGDQINATDIENLKNEIKHHSGKKTVAGNETVTKTSAIMDYGDDCPGIRCGRGRCVPLLEVCNGVRDCEDGKDEAEEACGKKNIMCNSDPYHKGCECSVGQMKCHNGKCIPKELFRDGNNDCGDGTDEPGQTICRDYLARVMPSKICDGILHCHDRSDEDAAFCKCFAKRNYKCGSKSEVDHCVALDTVCDGVRDCPKGEDEQTCMALHAPYGTPHGTGQIVVRSHGVWHSKCYASPNHTKSELEAICSELGFFSGHAKQIKEIKNVAVNPYNNLVIDPFNEIILNNNTIIKMRNNHEPLAKAVFDEELPNCYPVFIECR